MYTAVDNSGVQESQNVKPGAGHGLRARLGRGLGDKEMTCKARVRSTDSERVTGPDGRPFECGRA